MQLHSYIDCMGTPSGPRLCYALAARKSARYLSRLYGSHLAPAGLSVSQFSILGLLGVHGRLKITELADMLIMERTSLVRALKPLQAAGLVVAERSDNGRACALVAASTRIGALAVSRIVTPSLLTRQHD